MKQLIKFFLLIIFVGIVFFSCNKEELVEATASSESEHSVLSFNKMESEKIIATFKQNKSLSKGHCADAYWQEFGTAEYAEDSSYKFKTLKVYRQSNPDKYFYVMLTNLNIPDPLVSWSYAKDDSNDKLYGRLYSRYGADKYAGKLRMHLDVYKSGRTPRKQFVYGYLMTQEDLNDILEIKEYNPNEVYDLGRDYSSRAWDLYYDTFVFGEGNIAADSAAYHSLAGWKNSMSIEDQLAYLNPSEYPYLKMVYQAGYFTQKNHRGVYWMDYVDPKTDASDVFSITRHNYFAEDEDWSVSKSSFANNSYDLYGFSVRYVFDPFFD